MRRINLSIWIKSFATEVVRARRGNVAMIFALTVVPALLAGGAGIDLARSLAVRAKLYAAVDAAALAVASKSGITQSQANVLGQQYFEANYKLNSSFGSPAPVTVVLGANSVTVSTANAMPTTLMQIAGFQNVSLTASSNVVWGQTKLWVGLALDNTGSMCQSDTDTSDNGPCPFPASNTKIYALKQATKSLLGVFENAAGSPGDVQVSIAPFSRDVNVGAANAAATWIDWTDWDAANGTCSGGSGGSKKSCQDDGGAWTPASHAIWQGCVTDRGDTNGPSLPAFDVTNAAPNADAASKFPAHQYSSCPTAALGLSYDWTALDSKVDAMVATGKTNQTIGLAWAWQSMTAGAPANPPALPFDTQRYLVIVSDGENTENRWTGVRSDIDARMNLLCANARNDDIVIWAVFVNIAGTAGNAQSMKDCATGGANGGHYIEVTSTQGIGAAFDVIGQQITSLRIAH